jgi:hypothetical protein
MGSFLGVRWKQPPVVDSNGTKLRIDLNALASRYKDLITATKDVATIIALIIAGLWTYALTKQFRDTVPKLAIKHDVSCWRMRDGSLLVRLDSTLTNTGKVLIRGLNGRLIVLRMLPETDEQAVAYAHGDIFYHARTRTVTLLRIAFPNKDLTCLPLVARNLRSKIRAEALSPANSKHIGDISSSTTRRESSR